ncbi:hypothetical protein BRC86_00060 [Halobacteriales archaeon QS_3_64_16]|nr:MAG: hypothetical protein BRC86_00060 [Halobacteriales archaeon QS_3_64_16]
MSDHGSEREYDREYTLIAHPLLRIRLAADADTEGPEACSIAIDYDERGLDNLPERTTGGRSAVEWRGVEIDAYRHGDRVLEEGIDLDTSEVLGYVDDLAEALGRLSRRAR